MTDSVRVLGQGQAVGVRADGRSLVRKLEMLVAGPPEGRKSQFLDSP